MIKKLQKKVSLESLDGRIDGLDGRIDGLDGKMEGLDERMGGLDTRLERVEESQRKTGVQLDRLEYKFDLCIEGFDSLKERAEKIEDRVSILEGDR